MAGDLPRDKAEILARMAERHRALIVALDRLDATAWERPGAWGAWTAKDLLAHLAYWMQVATDRLQKLADGRAAEIQFFDGDNTVDARNDEVYRANRDQSLADLRRGLDVAYLALRTAVKSTPATVLAEDQQPTPARAWVAGNSFEHVDEHIDSLTALAASSPEA